MKKTHLITLILILTSLVACQNQIVPEDIEVVCIHLNETEISLIEDETFQLSAEILPDNATNKNVKWSSDNVAIATVDENGLVKALKTGTANIKVQAEDGDVNATCTLTVEPSVIAVESVTLNIPEARITLPGEVQLEYVLIPENATNREVTWSSADESVAKVSETGLVTSVSEGKARIIITTIDGNKTDECLITVSGVAYIDEYGVNQGIGLEIEGIVWAPVNCGYHESDFKYGKLYQWGRKTGFSYSEEVDVITSNPGDITIDNTDPSEFYRFWGEIVTQGDWGGEDGMTKTENDPCPEGWRVPTKQEIEALSANASEWTTVLGRNGHWFTGSAPYSENLDAKIFLTADGQREWYDASAEKLNETGAYWTTTQERSQWGEIGYTTLRMHEIGGINPNVSSPAFANSVRCVLAK